MEENKTYTASDFARYYAGTMPAAEMYAMEKAALEDPFLADALDGYAYSNTPEKDVAQMRELLKENRRKNKKVFSIAFLAQNKWWRVAALVIIIAGAGYLFYRTNNMATQNSLADNDREKSPAKVEAPSLVLKDTGLVNNDVALKDKKEPGVDKSNKASLPKPKTVIQREKISPQPMSNADEDAASLMMSRANPSADSMALRESINKNDTSKQYVLKGKVKDDTGAPVPYAIISNTKQRMETTADKNGDFSLASADSNVNVIASAVGYSSKDALLQSNLVQTIKINKTESSLSEAVVSGYGTKRKKAVSANAKNLQGKVSGVEIQKPVIPPFPVNEKFTKYLQENLVPMYDENNNRLTGEVVLSFSINKKRRPRNITVLRSTCKDCEGQAIHLLENGPDWEGRENVAGTVEIMF